MALVVRAFPVRDRARVDAFVSELQHRAAETRRFYNALGVRREAWFWQDGDHQAFVICVTDVDDPIGPAVEAYAAADGDFARWFKAQVMELSGVDPNEQPLGPVSEQVFDSSLRRLQDGVTLIVRAYPIYSREIVLRFVEELGAKPDEIRSMYERFGVQRESWFIQETPSGPMTIAVAAIPDPDSAACAYAKADDPCTVWFKQRVVEVSGVDPNHTPLGPRTTLLYDYQA
jgi:hypothetical protein